MEEEVLLQEAQLVNHQVRQKALRLSKQSLSTTLYAYTSALCDLGAVTHFMHEFYDQNGWPEVDAFQKETSPLYWEIVDAYQNLSNYAKDARIFDSYHPRWQDPAYQQIVKLLKQVEITSRTGDYQITRDMTLVKKAVLCHTIGLSSEILERQESNSSFQSDDESNWNLLLEMWNLYQNNHRGIDVALDSNSKAQYTEEITPLLSYIDKNYSYRNDYERERYQKKILTR